MTTIAYRNGVMAADSQTSTDTEGGGARYFKCVKLYRKFAGQPNEAILGTAGETFSGLVFVDWYGTGKDAPENLIHGDADFTVIVLTRVDGKHVLTEFDKWCRGDEIIEPFYAVGSGAKGALVAMHCGKSAQCAVEITCLVDTYSRLPVHTMKLPAARPLAKKAVAIFKQSAVPRVVAPDKVL